MTWLFGTHTRESCVTVVVTCRRKKSVLGVAKQLPAINHQVRWGTPFHFRFRSKTPTTRVFFLCFLFFFLLNVRQRFAVEHNDDKAMTSFIKRHLTSEFVLPSVFTIKTALACCGVTSSSYSPQGLSIIVFRYLICERIVKYSEILCKNV